MSRAGTAINRLGVATAGLPLFSSFARLHTLTSMAEKTENPLELILQLCSAAAPNPWYPSVYAKAAGINRDSLDPHLDRLRLAGLIQLTDWMHGTGQGYILTLAGRELLANPRSLALLRSGTLRLEAQAPPPPLLDESATKLFARGDAVRDVFMVQTPARVTYLLIFLNLLVFGYGWQLAQQNGLPTEEYLGTANPLASLPEAHSQAHSGLPWRRGDEHPGLDPGPVVAADLELFRAPGHHSPGRQSLLALHGRAAHRTDVGRPALFHPLPACRLRRQLFDGLFQPCQRHWRWTLLRVAIWGLMTSLVAWLLLNRAYMPRPFLNNMLRRLLNVILLNVFISFMPGISMAAHFGGGAAGIAAAVLLHGNRHGKGLVRILATIGVVLFPVACFGALYLGLKANPEWDALDFLQRGSGDFQRWM